ncbi:MAG TPA: hypothetical protein VMT20_13305 [Terriglobia bacterium]|nr:hypothetical protein [Terriglobia bacterium]
MDAAESFRERNTKEAELVSEIVTLPKSGINVRLAPLRPEWIMAHGLLFHRMTMNVGERGKALTSEQEILEFAEMMIEAMQAVFVEPRVRLNPGRGEIPPWLVDNEDALFAVSWAIEKAASGGGIDLRAMAAWGSPRMA